jgi:hypothetical protein
MADINGIPYVEATDLVSAYPGVSLALATELDDQLGSKVPFEYSDTEPTTGLVGGFIWFDTNETPPTPNYYDDDAEEFVPFPSGAGDADFSDAATGTYSDSGIDYKYITYNSSGTLTVTEAGLATVLIIAGGGGGGSASQSAVGGGAGGYIAASNLYLEAGSITVTVGAGGAAINQGNASRFDVLFATGGGRGLNLNSAGAGVAGGSGGGGSDSASGGAGVVGQGNNGGSGANSAGGGGGGAGAVGGNATNNNGGNGGAGVASSITGSSVGRAGGGGARGASTLGTATDGGGGASTGTGTAGSANTGGGGGGGGTGGAGGSGVVIVRVRT